MTLSVLIADDHELFRSGLKQLLMDNFDQAIVRETANLDDAVELLGEEGAFDLVLLDLRMPGMSGVEALGALCDGFPEARVAVVSGSQDQSDILAALAAGVHGYVPKTLPAREIVAALRGILEGQIFVPPAVRLRGQGRRESADINLAQERMTTRQREVMEEMLKGRSSKEIARTLNIAEGTVKIHLAAIYRALGVKTRAEAIAKVRA